MGHVAGDAAAAEIGYMGMLVSVLAFDGEVEFGLEDTRSIVPLENEKGGVIAAGTVIGIGMRVGEARLMEDGAAVIVVVGDERVQN